MNAEFKEALLNRETDLDAALSRLAGDEDVYEMCLEQFLNDNSIAEIFEALKHDAWDDAFTAAHALKGVAGNMGFIPLYHAAAEVVILIRSGRINELRGSCMQLKQCFDDISNTIRRYCKAQNT